MYVDPSSRPVRSATPLLVAIMLVAFGAVIAWLPLVKCSDDPYVAYTDTTCSRCGGRGRIPLLRRWRLGDTKPPLWEGMRINWIEGSGFAKTNFRQVLDQAGIFGSLPITNESRLAAADALLATGRFERVRIVASVYQSGSASLKISVVERVGISDTRRGTEAR